MIRKIFLAGMMMTALLLALQTGEWIARSETLDFLHGIALDSSDNVYVTDTCNNRILKFTSDGTLILYWGSDGSMDGQLDHPEGVAVDADLFVYVADTENNRIQKFDLTGRFL